MRRRSGPNNNRQGHSNNNGGGQRRHSGGGHHNNNNNNRPRKNYPQLREKYLNQAKDALSMGDRVMAEYYFQHADHCYRMMMEQGYRPPSEQQQQQEEGAEGAEQQTTANSTESPMEMASEEPNINSSALPTFLTMGYTAAAATSNQQQAAAEPAQGQWEEN